MGGFAHPLNGKVPQFNRMQFRWPLGSTNPGPSSSPHAQTPRNRWVSERTPVHISVSQLLRRVCGSGRIVGEGITGFAIGSWTKPSGDNPRLNARCKDHITKRSR